MESQKGSQAGQNLELKNSLSALDARWGEGKMPPVIWGGKRGKQPKSLPAGGDSAWDKPAHWHARVTEAVPGKGNEERNKFTFQRDHKSVPAHCLKEPQSQGKLIFPIKGGILTQPWAGRVINGEFDMGGH